METIFKALRKDHEIQRELLEKLVNTSGDTEVRRKIFDQLVKEMEKHEKFEERYFYKPLFSDNLTQDHARHGIAEHQEIDNILDDLKEMSFSSTGWLTRAKTLKEKTEHHLVEEEQKLFQLAGNVIREDDKKDLARKYNQKMEETYSTTNC